jgi:RNA polymerase sigma factor (sigma-70 family)
MEGSRGPMMLKDEDGEIEGRSEDRSVPVQGGGGVLDPAGSGGLDHETGLFLRCRSGDETAASELLESVRGPALGVASRILGNSHDADDAFNDAWAKAISPKTTVNVRAFRSWFLEVVRTSALKILEKKKRHAKHTARLGERLRPSFLADEESGEWAHHALSVDHEEAEEDDTRYVWPALKALPEGQRAPLLNVYFYGHTYDEAGAIEGDSRGVFAHRLGHARDALSVQVLELKARDALYFRYDSRSRR